MNLQSTLLKHLKEVLNPKPAAYHCPVTGKTFYAGKCYDQEGNLMEANVLGSEPFIAEVMLFAGNFAPLGWAFCQGQLLAISQNDALFSLIGTIYGGDGQTTFGLPDFRGRIPIGAGNGPGLSPHIIGESAGTESVTITTGNMPISAQTVPIAKNRAIGTATTGVAEGRIDGTKNLTVGGGQPHTNVPPFLGMNYCIAVEGIYPTRS